MVRADEWGSFLPERSLLTPTRYMLCHCSSPARACDRPQHFPMSMSHVRGLRLRPTACDLLSVCLQLFLYGSNGIDSKMRAILYGRQLRCE